MGDRPSRQFSRREQFHRRHRSKAQERVRFEYPDPTPIEGSVREPRRRFRDEINIYLRSGGSLTVPESLEEALAPEELAYLTDETDLDAQVLSESQVLDSFAAEARELEAEEALLREEPSSRPDDSPPEDPPAPTEREDTRSVPNPDLPSEATES